MKNFMTRCKTTLLELNSQKIKTTISQPWKREHVETSTPEDVFYCFRILLGRSPHREEWQGHLGHAGNTNLDDLVRSYLESLEFSLRFKNVFQQRALDNISLKQLKEFSIYVRDGDSAVGKHISNERDYEPHVSAVFRDRIKSGMHVLDIGANIGYFTMLSASLTGSSGSVIAIEPNTDNIKLLEVSRRKNSFEHISVVQSAAGREIGLLVLNTSYSNGTTSSLSDDVSSVINSTTVSCLPIDLIVPQGRPIDFIKIDVEGAEYNALLGGSNLIRRYHPVITSEFSPDLMPGISGVDGLQYLQFLLDFGYKISVIELNGELSKCGQDIHKVMNAYRASGSDHIDILMD